MLSFWYIKMYQVKIFNISTPDLYQRLPYISVFHLQSFFSMSFCFRRVTWDVSEEDTVVNSLGIRSLMWDPECWTFARWKFEFEHLLISLLSNAKCLAECPPLRSPSLLKLFSMSWHWEGGWPWYRTCQKILSKSTPHITDVRNCTEITFFGLDLLAWESLESHI